MNNRFKYTITPGSDIYFVYNHNWIDDAGKYTTSSILGASKLLTPIDFNIYQTNYCTLFLNYLIE